MLTTYRQPRIISPYRPARGRYATAVTMARYAYKNRGKFKRAARMIGRAWKRRKVAANIMKRVGEMRSRDTAKTHTAEDSLNDNLETRQLYQENLLNIERAVSTNNIDQRQRDIVNVAGIKLCFMVRNNTTNPLLFSYAVIQPKVGQPFEDNAPDFFRGTGNTRSFDFNGNYNTLDYYCRPINSDKFNILMHKKLKVPPKSQSVSQLYNPNSGLNLKLRRHYLKINRQFRYQTNSALLVTPTIYFVYWADVPMQEQNATATPAFTFQRRFVTYFREPK